MGLNNGVGGKAVAFYLGGEEFAGAKDDTTFSNLFIDAYNQVFFSVGVCFGVMYAFSSYNQIKKPVIRDAFIIGFADFFYSFLSGFIAWGAIGYLFSEKDPHFTQTQSVALAMIAMPSAASAGGGTSMLTLFYVTLFFTGITSAAAYVEAFACNIIDQF
jgi:NSS family neurotransmitter:Na+ symporter